MFHFIGHKQRQARDIGLVFRRHGGRFRCSLGGNVCGGVIIVFDGDVDGHEIDHVVVVRRAAGHCLGFIERGLGAFHVAGLFGFLLFGQGIVDSRGQFERGHGRRRQQRHGRGGGQKGGRQGAAELFARHFKNFPLIWAA